MRSPKALVEALKFDPKVPGSIEYTTANWGNINYLEKSLYQVVYVQGKGCEQISMPNQSLESMKTAFLVERGECTFSLKSNNIKLAGGDLAMIYLSDSKVD